MRIANSISEKGKVLGRKRVRCCNGPDKDYSKKVRDNLLALRNRTVVSTVSEARNLQQHICIHV